MIRRTRFQVYFDAKQMAALQRLHEATGAPIAELVRRAVDLYLTTQGATPKKGTR